MTEPEAAVANLFACYKRDELLAALRSHFDSEIQFNNTCRTLSVQKEADDEWLRELKGFCEGELMKDKKRRTAVPHEYIVKLCDEIFLLNNVARAYMRECVEARGVLESGKLDPSDPDFVNKLASTIGKEDLVWGPE